MPNLKLIGAGIVLLLILVAAGSSYAWFQARKELAVARSTIHVLEASVESYRASAVEVQQVMQDHTANQQVINDALEANQDWAGNAVPDAVVDGLCKNSNCKTGKVQSSGD